MGFSIPVTTSYYAVVIPLKYESKMWFIIDPLSNEVWFWLLTSIPIYILAMGLTDYFYTGYADLYNLFGFVIRNVLSENFRIPHHTKAYQKILIIIWSWSMLVLVQSYSGNLTAMLAKSKLEAPIKTLEELLRQTEISWVMEKGSAEYYLSLSKPGSVLRRLYERATIMPRLSYKDKMMNGCFTAAIKQEGTSGSICGTINILTLMMNDYSKTGKCNYYMTEEKFIKTGAAIAFQVEQTGAIMRTAKLLVYFRNRVPS